MTSGSLSVEARTLVQVADYPVGASFGPRRLRDHEFVWIMRGSALWTVREHGADPSDRPIAQQRLRPGMIALARSGTVDSYLWDPDRISTHAYVHFTVTDPTGLPAESEWPSVRSMSQLTMLDGLSSYLLSLAGDGSAAAQRRSDELVRLLLDVFVTGPLPESGQRWPEPVTVIVEHVRRIWERDGFRIIAVDELEAAANISAGHVFRLFREQFGSSPARVLETVRLSKAAVALQRSNASISEVSELVGYTNPYHFSRRFSQTYGEPPGTFRRTQADTDPLWPVRDAGLLALAHAVSGR